jgi:hypothetical protein
MEACFIDRSNQRWGQPHVAAVDERPVSRRGAGVKGGAADERDARSLDASEHRGIF